MGSMILQLYIELGIPHDHMSESQIMNPSFTFTFGVISTNLHTNILE